MDKSNMAENPEKKTTWICRLDQYPQTNYSVTQSYANNFWGDVVLDNFNNVSRDANNILDQIYTKQICSDFYVRI